MTGVIVVWAVWVSILLTAITTLLIVKRNQLLPQERGMPLRLKLICGGTFRYGRFTLRLAYPFVQVRMYDDFFDISHLFSTRLYYEELISMSASLGRLMLECEDMEYPIILTANVEQLKSVLSNRVIHSMYVAASIKKIDLMMIRSFLKGEYLCCKYRGSSIKEHLVSTNVVYSTSKKKKATRL